jgi:formylglycine-generating enzyme required for sulfatase activity
MKCPACAGRIDAQADESDPAIFIEPVCRLAMVRIGRSTFRMGDTLGLGMETEQPVHDVELDAFYIGRFPVTQSQWMQLMPENPSRFQGPDLPVEQVTWDDARAFARRLTQANQGRRVFQLPTEAQWELAARSGGNDECYAGGDDIDTVAWYENNSAGRTHPVGAKAPNNLGIYDMSGNVWEWCEDAFTADAYHKHRRRNPLIDAQTAQTPERVIRGGSWNLDAWSARCARRFNFTADFYGPGLGFRLVMSPARL